MCGTLANEVHPNTKREMRRNRPLIMANGRCSSGMKPAGVVGVHVREREQWIGHTVSAICDRYANGIQTFQKMTVGISSSYSIPTKSFIVSHNDTAKCVEEDACVHFSTLAIS